MPSSRGPPDDGGIQWVCVRLCSLCWPEGARNWKGPKPRPGFRVSLQIAIVASQLCFTDGHVAPKRKDA